MSDLIFADSLSRLGTESAFTILARAGALAAQGRDIINLGIGQPDFKTPEHIVEAGIKALRDGYHGYTPANGLPELREAVAADLHRRHGVEVNPDHVVVVPGGKPTMFFAVLMFGQPGVEIMYPNPGFPIYESVIRYSGATPVPIALKEENGFAFSAEEVLGQITDKTRLIIINSPANPTGGVTPKEEIDKLVAGLQAHPHVALMSDEIYSNMLYGGREHVSLLQYPEIRDRLIMLDGWSKTYAMTGWRLGYAVWPDSCVEHVTRLCINDHSCVNAATQYAGIAALTGPQDAVRDMVAAFDQRREVIVRELNSLPGVSCADAGGAFYAFPNITGTGMSSVEAQDRFLDEVGVATVAGTSFGAWGEGYVRFSYANSTENILEAIRRIRGIL
ncbi:pyridoxal phosphate-dependent aminotransferase [Rhodalgimonas zhirmunskyi]|uniref:aspartate transaminase n=1 Tax=Rhodalgimonas zhirmunskyi TaxID=2964767 RepID=A0AAJ1U7V3_9RHOB|nr:pyridoxal phosphate-dependent aminotransferase [Rhodoalgimonas zhirmunskyi]MDQ2095026.1 pyridoxal phosphate-dependent aminotransferase [Rhodoalgimonas zhirmunskyi]